MALVHDHDQAQDLAQQAWLRLQSRHGTAFELPQLLATIRNLAIDHHRHHQRWQMVSLDSLDEIAPVGAVGDLALRLDRLDLDRLLAQLHFREREALFLNSVMGYTAQQIADLTHQPRSTVLSLLARAKQRLRRLAQAESGSRTSGGTAP
jgi:RNA polymerase sigma-70 factor, ECF subfamily